MSSIIDNFVSVNIKRHQNSGTTGVYNTAVYVVAAPGEGESSINLYYAKNGNDSNAGTKASPKAVPTATADPLAYAFFANGGQYLHKLSADLIVNGVWENPAVIPLDEIPIFKANGVSPAGWPTTTPTNTYPTGKYQKIFIVPVTSYAAKYTGEPSGVLCKYTYAASNCTSVAAAAAYFTQVNIKAINSVKDYAFTAEKVNNPATINTGDVTNDSTVVSSCITNNLNCNAKIAQKILNIGGNDAAGEGIMNLFMRIVLQQELANALFDTITKKIKYDDSGKAQLSATIANVMQTFISNGYVSTQKVWTDTDLYLDNELVISTNTPLIGGYILHIAPYSTVSATDKANGVFPTLTVIYGDFVGIRKVVLTGEAF